MSGKPAPRIWIGDCSHPPPGFRTLGSRADADIRYAPGSSLPFSDRVVDAIVCSDSIVRSEANLAHLLLECRRVLRPQGIVRVGSSSPDDVPRQTGAADSPPYDRDAERAEIARVAALVGLDPIGRTPVSADCRLALAALADPQPGGASEFTKRDRRLAGNPLVSILIPAYRPRYFPPALDSALAQTYSPFEIVVCDDSDGPAIEETVRARDARGRIRYERNRSRLGVRANHRRCFERAQGEFVKFLCDDDLLAPTCVENLLDAFRRAPDVTLATSHRQLIDAEGRRQPDQPVTAPIVEKDTLIAGYTLLDAMLRVGLNVIGEPSTTLFRKAELVDQAPQYFSFNGEEGHGIIDMVMWSTLLLRGDAVYRRESLSCFRIHRDQRQRDPAKMERNAASIHRLRAAWHALGLHRHVPRGQLLAKPFPPPAED